MKLSQYRPAVVCLMGLPAVLKLRAQPAYEACCTVMNDHFYALQAS